MASAAEIEEGYKQARGVIRKNITTPEVIDFYKTWSNKYDVDIGNISYPGPRMVAEFVLKYFPENKDIRILDVAGGTGLGAEELISRGYSNIDCVDGSSEMLDKARVKNVYKNIYNDFIGPNQIKGINNDSYDLTVTCGSFVEGHVSQACFPELLRIVKPGGHILILMGEHYLETVELFNHGKLDGAMEQVAKDGKWTKIRRDVIPNYSPVAKGSSSNGVLFIFKKA